MKRLRLKPGDIIAYNDCNTLGIFKKFNKKINDSRDVTFQTYFTLIENQLNHFNLVYSDDIRYANKKERKMILNMIHKNIFNT